MTKRRVLASVATVLTAVVMGASAQAADARVEKALKQADLPYEISEEGDFAVAHSFEDGRAQAVFITSKTTELGSLEMREIWSMGYAKPGTLPVDLANQLLQQNRELVVGSWQVLVEEGESLVLFGAQIPANVTDAELTDVLEIVAGLADDLEEKMTKKDEF